MQDYWQLSNLIYLNPLGEIEEITDSGIILTFNKEIDPENKWQ